MKTASVLGSSVTVTAAETIERNREQCYILSCSVAPQCPVHREYRDVVALHEELSAVGINLPSLPKEQASGWPASLMASLGWREDAKARARALEAYLNALVHMVQNGETKIVAPLGKMLGLASETGSGCESSMALDEFTKTDLSESSSAARDTQLFAVVDALFAAVTATLGICVLHCLERMLAFKLFESKMLGSIAVFCSPPSPPSLRNFAVCTACACLVGCLLHVAPPRGVLAPGVSLEAAHTVPAITVGLHLLLNKLTAHNFSPSIGFAVATATTPWESGSLQTPRRLLLTWLAGHALLYGWSVAMAWPRRAIRVKLVMRTWRAQSAERGLADGQRRTRTRRELRHLFAKYDTSGDGSIDSHELKLAFRSLTGEDVPLADCAAIIRAFDIDGDGTIDFEEFCHAVSDEARELRRLSSALPAAPEASQKKEQ